MNRDRIILLICFVVVVVATTVIVGWVCRMPWLVSVLPKAITMKFSTAVGFLCSALIIFLIRCYLQGQRNLAHTFLPLPCLVIGLLMSVMLSAMFLKISTGIENLFVQENPNAILKTYAGHPSIVTITDFLIIMVLGILAMAEPSFLRRCLKLGGVFVALTGLSAALGYMFNIPPMYYAVFVEGHAMAVNTSYLFILCGIALLLLGSGPSNHEAKA